MTTYRRIINGILRVWGIKARDESLFRPSLVAILVIVAAVQLLRGLIGA